MLALEDTPMTKTIFWCITLLGLGCSQSIKGKQEIASGQRRATFAVA